MPMPEKATTAGISSSLFDRDVELEHLEGLNAVFLLVLSNTKISDDGLRHLAGLPHLCKLDLSHTKITDAGLKHLERMTHLSYLNLSETGVTDDGVKMLQHALPKCTVHRKGRSG